MEKVPEAEANVTRRACRECAIEFDATPYTWICSDACRRARVKRRNAENAAAAPRKTARRQARVSRPCEGCGHLMERFSSAIRKFCSRACMNKHLKVDLICPGCKRAFSLARSVVVYRENRGKNRTDICCSLTCSYARGEDGVPSHRITGRSMIPRTDPQRCTGRCKRTLALADYPKHADGTPMLRCRECVQPADDQKRRSHLRSHYGITPEEWEAIYAAQGGRCAICVDALPTIEEMTKPATKRARWADRNWATDHCHYTGKVRGILCRLCNHALGGLRDSAAIALKASAYLDRHRVCTHGECMSAPAGLCTLAPVEPLFGNKKRKPKVRKARPRKPRAPLQLALIA